MWGAGKRRKLGKRPRAGLENMEKGRNRGKSHEPVVHSVEWTTSSVGKAGKGGNWGQSREPVVHFAEWTTSSGGKAGKGQETGEKL